MTARRNARGARLLMAAVAVVTLTAGAVPATAVEGPASMVEVRSPALSYADGTLTGTVEMSGGCLPADPVLSIPGDRCPAAGPARATLPHARLGFHATRTAQGGDSDTPVLHDASGTRRTVTLQLQLAVAGDVQVTMHGLQAEGMSPAAVDGSAVPDAAVDGATVTWTLLDLAAGEHQLRAAFDLGPLADGVRFSPQIIIERSAFDRAVAGHWRGDITSSETVSAIHRLVLEQRSGGDGPPSLQAPAFTTVDQGDALAWTVEPGLTANGRFLPTDGAVEAARELLLPAELIAQRGLQSTGMAFTAMRPPGAAKDRLEYGLRWPELGFHYTVASPEPVVDPWEQRPLAALYEGDSTQAAIIADASPVDRAGEERPPSGPQGRLVLTANGPVTDAVATLAYTHLDGADANSLDPESLRSACGDAALLAAVSGEVFTLTADGDVDNSDGAEPLAFEPVRIPHPAGYSRSTVLTLRGGDPEAVAAYELKLTFTDTETIVTPVVPAGQTFLSTRIDDDGRRSWVAHPALTIFYSRTRCPVTPTTGRLQSVPPAAIAEMTLHAPHRPPARAVVGPGVWAASTTGGRLKVQAAG